MEILWGSDLLQFVSIKHSGDLFLNNIKHNNDKSDC